MNAPLSFIPGGAKAAGALAAPGREARVPGLLEKLVAAVRPEFRSAVLVFDSADLVFGAAPCAVADCGYPGRTRGLCTAHNQRWMHAGRPELTEFITHVSPHRKGHAPFKSCRAPGCGFGVSRTGLCQRHDGAWRRAGQPDQDAWLARYPPRAEPEHELCPAAGCGLWTQGSMPLCLGHAARWRGLGRPQLGCFLAELAAPKPVTTEPIDLAMLESPLRMEIQYALQCRWDEKGTKVIPACARAVANFLAREQARSLLDRTEAQWRQAWAARFRQTRVTGSGKLPLLIYARRQVELLAFGSGWESEYERDVWRLAHLGSKVGRRNVRFDKIPQPWFKELAKRRVRLQLAAGRSPGHAINTARAATVFALFIDEIEVEEITQITRQVLERFLAHLSGLGHSPSHTGSLIGSQRFVDRGPPPRLGHCAAARRGLLPGRLPHPAGAAAPRPARARPRPTRGPGQPRPVRRPGIRTGHPDPDPYRAAHLRRPGPDRKLPGLRREQRPLPAVCQPQDET